MLELITAVAFAVDYTAAHLDEARREYESDQRNGEAPPVPPPTAEQLGAVQQFIIDNAPTLIGAAVVGGANVRH